MKPLSVFRSGALALLLGSAAQVHALTQPEWAAEVAQLSRVPVEKQVQAVTDWVHLRVRYADDPDDVWESPLEALTSGEGDCEDFAFAKYALLRQLGWQSPQIRLAYAYTWAVGKRTPHMVVLADAGQADDPLVLDNLGDLPVRLSVREDLEIVFSFSEEHIWEGPSTRRLHGPAQQLSRWTTMVRRMRNEGTLPAR